jgi:hypothetical protein
MTSSDEPGPGMTPQLEGFLRRRLGAPPARVERSPTATLGPLWTLEHPQLGALYLKLCSSDRSFRQERDALRDWGPGLTAAGNPSPLLVATDRPTRALVTTRLDGRSADRLRGEPLARCSYVAGRALKTLHALPCDDQDPMPLLEAVGRRSAHHAATGAGRATRARLLEALAELAAGEALRRVPCHRDYQPQNWRWGVDSATGFGLLDFEHARLDLWLYDLLRLENGLWRRAPALKRRFFDGYGRAPNKVEGRALDALAWLDASDTLRWAERRGDGALASQARALLESRRPQRP